VETCVEKSAVYALRPRGRLTPIHRVISLRCGIWPLSAHSGHIRSVLKRRPSASLPFSRTGKRLPRAPQATDLRARNRQKQPVSRTAADCLSEWLQGTIAKLLKGLVRAPGLEAGTRRLRARVLREISIRRTCWSLGIERIKGFTFVGMLHSRRRVSYDEELIDPNVGGGSRSGSRISPDLVINGC
jgi:hypothetical protein